MKKKEEKKKLRKNHEKPSLNEEWEEPEGKIKETFRTSDLQIYIAGQALLLL